MELFLIKSFVAMAILLALYHLLLEREKMHRFNRFYLLGAVVFSLALPFITIITYIKKVKILNERAISTLQPVVSSTFYEQPIDYLFYIGWSIYALITFVLAIRFVKNVIPLMRKASNNPSVKMGTATLVLLEEKVLPHTFLSYIFVNREEHEARLIEEELHTHELTHVKQKHTLDILFIEVLKTIFWFNPLFYFYKKAIQLNHEFLADEKVIDTTANTVYYQNLLLEKASVGTTFSIASNLNFSLTKKRLLMMTKSTSATKASLLKTAVAPAVAALMMLLCTETVAQEAPTTAPPKQKAETVKTNKTQPGRPRQKVKEAKSVTDKTKPDMPAQSREMKEGLTSDSENFSSKDSYTLKLSGEIDPAKVQSVKISQLTESQINTLKEIDPEKYNDATLKDYVAMKITSINDNGELAEEITYKKKP